MRNRARRALLAGLILVPALAIASPARADSVTDWNATAAAALQSPGSAIPPGAGQGAISGVHLAMVHIAVYDAVNAIAGGHEPYLSSPSAEPGYSQDAAVAAAARYILLNGEMGIPAGRIPAIEAAYQATLAGVPDGPAEAGGIAVGVAAATALDADRTGDGRFTGFVFPNGSEPGAWRPTTGMVTDPAAWLKDVRPFVLPDPDKFRANKPHSLTSRAYAVEFNEVKAIGSLNSSVRSTDQTLAAQFWGAGNATATAANLMRSVANTDGGTVAEHARLFARTYANVADTAIVTWRDKARYLLWRPITAIREAASDGNPATVADPAWTSLIASPPYPDHPSGLSGLGCSIADSLQYAYGTDAMGFTATNSVPTTRSYASFSQMCDEIVEARIWSGIHFRFADEEAEQIGRRVAHWGNRHAFR